MRKILFAILTMTFLGTNAVNAQGYPPQLTPHQDNIARVIFADTTLPSFDSIPSNSAFDYEKDCMPLFLPFDHNTPPVLVEMCVKKKTDTTIVLRVRIVDVSETNFVLLGSLGVYLLLNEPAQNYYGHCHAELNEGFYNGEEPTNKWLPKNEKAQSDKQNPGIELMCPNLWEDLADRMLDYAYRKTEQ